jgi:hypothetical protein
MAELPYLSTVNLKRPFLLIDKAMDILKLSGQNLGLVYNYICWHVSLYLEIRRHNTQHNDSSIIITTLSITVKNATLSIYIGSGHSA